MPKAQEMQPIDPSFASMDTAAMEQRRVRMRGIVVARGTGQGGGYRNIWLHVRMTCATVQITASPSSRLGNAQVGAELDFAVTLTGVVDLSKGLYYGRRAQLLELARPQE
jgi:hypothetical protein